MKNPERELVGKVGVDVRHFIDAPDLAIIKAGSENRFFTVSLALGGGAVGLIQNLISVLRVLASEASVPLAVGDVIGAGLFLIFVTGAFTLFLYSRDKERPLKSLVKRIEAREKKPFKVEPAGDGR